MPNPGNRSNNDERSENRPTSNRRKVLGTIGGVAVFGLAGCSSDEDGSGDPGGDGSGDGQGGDGGGGGSTQDWIVGTSTEGTASFATGQAYQSVIQSESDRVNFSAQVSQGVNANMYALAEGEYDAAFDSDITYVQAQDGLGEFEDDPPENFGWKGHTQLRGEYIMVTHADRDDIETISDLAGKSGANHSSGSAVASMWEELFNILGIWDDYDYHDISYGDHASALNSGRIDVSQLMLFNNGEVVTGASQQIHELNDNIKYIGYSEEEMETIEQSNFPAQFTTIEADEELLPDLAGQELTVWTLNSGMTWGEHLSQEDVYHVNRLLLDNMQDVRDAVDLVWDYSQEENFTAGISEDTPVHPGVAELLQEEGWWQDDWTIGGE